MFVFFLNRKTKSFWYYVFTENGKKLQISEKSFLISFYFQSKNAKPLITITYFKVLRTKYLGIRLKAKCFKRQIIKKKILAIT